MSRFYDPNTLEGRLRQEIVFLKNKLEEIEAIEKYFERNFLLPFVRFSQYFHSAFVSFISVDIAISIKI